MTDSELMNRTVLNELAIEGAGGPHISLYSPMVKAGPETRQNPIRFKNLLRQAREALAQWQLDSSDINALLVPLQAWVDDHPFWQHQEAGLAVFVRGDEVHSYRLPIAFSELCVVAERFHLKPLFQLLSGDGRFHVLALSQNAVRLLECSQHAVRGVQLGDDVPTSLADALGHDLTEQHLQSHSPNQGEAIFHAQGGGEDDVKAEIRKFLTMVDSGVTDRVDPAGGEPPQPLIIAAVDSLAAMYRELSDHKRIMGSIVAGNPEHRSDDELKADAWRIVSPHFDQDRLDGMERFGQASADNTGSNAVDEIVIAAEDGRVDTLFVALGVRHWGRFDEATRQVSEELEHAPGNEDLFDRAAVATWRNGGTVYAMEPDDVPGDAPLAAIFRY